MRLRPLRGLTVLPPPRARVHSVQPSGRGACLLASNCEVLGDREGISCVGSKLVPKVRLSLTTSPLQGARSPELLGRLF